MRVRFHHAHLFSSDLETTLRWWSDNFGAIVRHDITFAEARNVFVSIGDGRLHFYDQPPTGDRRGPIHHLGFQTDDLPALVRRLESNGVEFRKPITTAPDADYVMVEAPDGILLELFQPHSDEVSPSLVDFFAWPATESADADRLPLGDRDRRPDGTAAHVASTAETRS